MRTSTIRTFAALVIAVSMFGAALAGGPSTSQVDAGGEGDVLTLNGGGQFVFWQFQEVSAADVFTTVKIAWLFDQMAVSWTSFVPALGVVNFALVEGAVLWVVSEGPQTILLDDSSTVIEIEIEPIGPDDDDAGSSGPLTGTFQSGLGGSDPLILRFEPDPGTFGTVTAMELFGPSSATAVVVESTNLYLAGESEPITISHNEDGWPVRIQGPDGTTLEFVYGSTTVDVHFLLATGEFGVETVPLTAGMLATLDRIRDNTAANRAALGGAALGAAQLHTAQDDDEHTITRTIIFNITVLGTVTGEEYFPLPGARLVTTIEGFPPTSMSVGTPNSDGFAQITLIWQVALLEEARNAAALRACEDRLLPAQQATADNAEGIGIVSLVIGVLNTGAGVLAGLVGLAVGEDNPTPLEIRARCVEEARAAGTLPQAELATEITIRAEHSYVFPGGLTPTFIFRIIDLEAQRTIDHTFFIPVDPIFCPTTQGSQSSHIAAQQAGSPIFDPDSVFAVPGVDCDDIDDFDDDFEDFDDDFDDDSDDDDVDAEPLQITSVDFPGSVVSGAPAAPLTVTWSGDAVSPLTLTYRPRSCEGGFTCFTVTDTFDDPGSTLVFVDAVFCFGFSETVFFDYEVVLSDASGQTSAPVAAGFTCVPD